VRAHLDLLPQELELLGLGLGLASVVLERSGHLRSALHALLLPRLEKLHGIRVVVDGLVEQGDHMLLPPQQLALVMRLEVNTPVSARLQLGVPRTRSATKSSSFSL